jgi:hypothetical protein
MIATSIVSVPATTLDERDPRADFVTVCSWCTPINIMSVYQGDGDSITVLVNGKEVEVWRNGVKLTVSHGICDKCRERLKNS